MMTRRIILALSLALTLTCLAQAQVLMKVSDVSPLAVATGTLTEVRVEGTGMHEVVAADSIDDGVSVEWLSAGPLAKFKVSVPSHNESGFVTIALKARGQVPSEIRLPCVPPDRLVREAEPNNGMDQAQMLPLGGGRQVALGVLTGADDQDVFSFAAGKGMRLRATMRLSGRVVETTPSLVLFDASHAEVGRDNGGSESHIKLSQTLPESEKFLLVLQCTQPNAEGGAEKVDNFETSYSLEIAISNDDALDGAITVERLTHVTPGRIARLLPVEERPAWLTYLEKSQAKAVNDRRVLAEELKALGRESSDKAPSGGSPPRIPSKQNAAAWLADPATLAVAESVVSYQTPDGGWSKAVKYSEGPRPTGTHWTTQSGEGWHYCGTLDNRATSTEITFLSAMHKNTSREDFKECARRGLRWILDAQFPNGGWPQTYPLESGYHEHITFNDGAMLHALELVSEVASGVDVRLGR